MLYYGYCYQSRDKMSDSHAVCTISINRQRAVTQLEDRFIKSGLDSLVDYEILELLFSLASPYRDACYQLRNRFGIPVILVGEDSSDEV